MGNSAYVLDVCVAPVVMSASHQEYQEDTLPLIKGKLRATLSASFLNSAFDVGEVDRYLYSFLLFVSV